MTQLSKILLFKPIKALSVSVIAVMVFSGCQSLLTDDRYSSDPTRTATDGELALKDTIVVREQYARAIIQNGAIVNKPDLYTPWCTMHIFRTRSDIESKTEIQSDTFKIRNVYRFVDYMASLDGTRQPYLVAHTGPLLFHEEPSNVTFSTVFELVSKKQPGVTKMVCSLFDDPRTGEAPSLMAIKKTLGAVAQLKVAAAP